MSTPSVEENKNQTRIWLSDLGSGETWEATSGSGSERSPRWSPDGKTLSYISTREEGAQIWRLPIRGGEPTRITRVPGGIGDFWVSPGGKALFYVKDVKWPADAGDRPAERRLPDRGEALERPVLPALERVAGGAPPASLPAGTRRHHRHRRDALSTGTSRPLALGGVGVALSQFGTELAIVFNPDSVAGHEHQQRHLRDGPRRQRPAGHHHQPANDNSPAYSPDSRYVAYLAMTVPGFEADRQQIMLYERATGRRRALTAEWTLSVDAITWTPDSRALIAEVPERGGTSLYRIDLPGGRRTLLVSGGTNHGVRIPPRGEEMVFTRSTADRPAEVWAANWTTGVGPPGGHQAERGVGQGRGAHAGGAVRVRRRAGRLGVRVADEAARDSTPPRSTRWST